MTKREIGLLNDYHTKVYETLAPHFTGSWRMPNFPATYKPGSLEITIPSSRGTQDLTAEEKRAYTLALKGHLRLGAVKFTEGVCGQNLDVLARQIAPCGP